MNAKHPPSSHHRHLAALGAVLFLLLGTLVGCASSGGGADSDPDSAPAVGTSAMVMDDPSSATLRQYLIHPPSAGVSQSAVPLVVVLHGAGSDPGEIEASSGFSALADQERFVVVYPEATGTGEGRSWNAGFCCGRQAEEGVDDVGFVLRVVDHVAERVPVDRERVYLVGYAEGGMLAYRVASERTGELAALAVVAGAMGVRVPGEEEPRMVPPARFPLPVMIMHSLGDESIHYWERDAGQGPVYVDVVKAVERWVVSNVCGFMPKIRNERDGLVLRRSFVGQAPVEVVVLKAWGHGWPGRQATDQLPESSALRGFDAAEVIWGFLAVQTRRGLLATE
jgi:polyhydroxybutyrate depolymerase